MRHGAGPVRIQTERQLDVIDKLPAELREHRQRPTTDGTPFR